MGKVVRTDGFCGRFRRIVSGSLPPLQCLWNLRPPPFAVARLCVVRVLAFKVKFFTAAVSRFPSLLLFQSDFSQPIKGPAGVYERFLLCRNQSETKLNVISGSEIGSEYLSELSLVGKLLL